MIFVSKKSLRFAKVEPRRVRVSKMMTTITIAMALAFVTISLCYIWLLSIGTKDKDAITFDLLATTTFISHVVST
jgi:hypothetical protein